MLGFERVAEKQYTRNLLFSTLFDLMIQVVLPQQTSMQAAYRAQVQNMEVSVTSVYNKLKALEVNTASELVGYAAEQAETLIEELNGARAPLLPGVRVKVLDGNGLGGCEHRLKEIRQSTAGIPGRYSSSWIGLSVHAFIDGPAG